MDTQYLRWTKFLDSVTSKFIKINYFFMQTVVKLQLPIITLTGFVNPVKVVGIFLRHKNCAINMWWFKWSATYSIISFNKK